MKISKTRIENKIRRKSNQQLASLIRSMKKNNQLKLASMLGLPKRNAVMINLDKLNKETNADEMVIVPGKILGQGNINHKLTIAAFRFSANAKEKLKKAGCKFVDIEDIAANKTAKILK